MAERFGEVGVSGLTQYGGHIQEEWLRQLDGERGRKVFREMADNDATVGAVLFAIEMLLRNVNWRVEAASDKPEHREQAEFVESLMTDMSHTWADFIAEVLTMLVYGFAPHEIVYKRRDGPDQSDARRRSRFDDGLIGWRKLPLRAQSTLDRWDFDDDGGIRGFWQTDPTGGPQLYIPIEKTLLFRTTSRKNNPEGRSALRNAYVAWYHKTRIAENEAIGVERDLAGMPIFYLPPQMFDPDAPASVQSQLAEYKKIVQNIKNDEQAGLLLPTILDPETREPLLKFELAGTGSRRIIDTGAVIQRYDRQMAMTLLSDFIMLGHEKVGSFALSSDKTELFSTALGAWLNEIAATLNRHALPRLYGLNGWDQRETAQFVPGDIEKPDLEKLSTAITNLTTAGWITPGSEEDEDHVRGLLDLPAVPEGMFTPPPNTEDTDDGTDDAEPGTEQVDPEDPGAGDDPTEEV